MTPDYDLSVNLLLGCFYKFSYELFSKKTLYSTKMMHKFALSYTAVFRNMVVVWNFQLC